MKKIIKFIPFFVLLLVLALSIGFSAFHSELLVSDIGAEVRIEADIRVTNVYSSNPVNNGTSNWEEYNVNNITSSLNLPNSNSTITYNVTITNFGNAEMGILSISGLPSNLTYSISGYTMKDTLCDDNNSSKCKLGSISTFTITVGYANNGYNSSSTHYQIKLDFDFERVYTISYSGFTNVSGLPTSILGGDSKTITFNSTTSIPNSVTVTGATGNYTSPTLTISSATDNVLVTGISSGSVEVIDNGDGTTTTTTTTIPTNISILKQPTGAARHNTCPCASATETPR